MVRYVCVRLRTLHNITERVIASSSSPTTAVAASPFVCVPACYLRQMRGVYLESACGAATVRIVGEALSTLQPSNTTHTHKNTIVPH